MSRWMILGGFVVTLGACVAEPSSPPPPDSAAVRGVSLFRAYCAPCHGDAARGDGPRALELTQTPADLTGIAARNGGLFIDDAVAAYIDGRAFVEAHGPTDMPVWGRILDDRNDALAEESKLTPSMIADIVAYLGTVQTQRD